MFSCSVSIIKSLSIFIYIYIWWWTWSLYLLHLIMYASELFVKLSWTPPAAMEGVLIVAAKYGTRVYDVKVEGTLLATVISFLGFYRASSIRVAYNRNLTTNFTTLTTLFIVWPSIFSINLFVCKYKKTYDTLLVTLIIYMLLLSLCLTKLSNK
jgi:hypothetical protein